MRTQRAARRGSRCSAAWRTPTQATHSGRYVWGEGATDTSRAVGLLAGGLLLGTAGFVATSRFDDGRHNLTDIVAGAALGVALATFSYWRRFDADGRPRRAVSSIHTGVDVSGRGLNVRFDF